MVTDAQNTADYMDEYVEKTKSKLKNSHSKLPELLLKYYFSWFFKDFRQKLYPEFQ